MVGARAPKVQPADPRRQPAAIVSSFEDLPSCSRSSPTSCTPSYPSGGQRAGGGSTAHSRPRPAYPPLLCVRRSRLPVSAPIGRPAGLAWHRHAGAALAVPRSGVVSTAIGARASLTPPARHGSAPGGGRSRRPRAERRWPTATDVAVEVRGRGACSSTARSPRRSVPRAACRRRPTSAIPHPLPAPAPQVPQQMRSDGPISADGSVAARGMGRLLADGSRRTRAPPPGGGPRDPTATLLHDGSPAVAQVRPRAPAASPCPSPRTPGCAPTRGRRSLQPAVNVAPAAPTADRAAVRQQYTLDAAGRGGGGAQNLRSLISFSPRKKIVIYLSLYLTGLETWFTILNQHLEFDPW